MYKNDIKNNKITNLSTGKFSVRIVIIRLYVEYYSTLESNLAHELAHVWAIKNLNISLDKEEDFATYIQRFIGDYPKESKKY